MLKKMSRTATAIIITSAVIITLFLGIGGTIICDCKIGLLASVLSWIAFMGIPTFLASAKQKGAAANRQVSAQAQRGFERVAVSTCSELAFSIGESKLAA